jgi:hypothetical protein
MLAALAALFAAAPACAQTAQTRIANVPAEKYVVAPGGVDMRTGRFAYSRTDLAAGGEGAPSLERILPDHVASHANPFGNFSHNWDIYLLETRVDLRETLSIGTDYRMTAHYGGRALTFEAFADQNYLYKSDGPSALLTFAGGDKASDAAVYTLRAPDGTLLTFRPIGSGDCADQAWGTGRRRCAFVSEIVEPDGTKYGFDYAATGAATGNRARLVRVTSSRGYALLLEGSGSLVSKACLLNLASAPAPANGLCPAGAPAVATYAYAGARLASVTDAVNAVSGFTYADGANGAFTMGFVKPGQNAPWLTNQVSILRDEEDAPQEIVDRQSFADGQTYAYGWNYAPITETRPYATVAGGGYTDYDGRQTGVRFDFPIAPGSGPTTVCVPHPCADENPDDFQRYVYQQTPGPVEVIDPLQRHTLMDYCDPQKLASPAPYGGCAVSPLQCRTPTARRRRRSSPRPNTISPTPNRRPGRSGSATPTATSRPTPTRPSMAG